MLSLLMTALLFPGFTPAQALDATTVCMFLSKQTDPIPELKDKMLVVTEERLGAADDKNTFNCFRKIQCTVNKPDAATKGTTATDLIRKCEPTYTSSSCTSTPAKDMETQMGMKEGNTYTICEPIMVYVSAAGTELLYYYMGQIYRYTATVGGLLAVLILIVAGVMRSTAGDNTNQVTSANNLIKKCIYGLVVLFSSAIILYTINPNFFVTS